MKEFTIQREERTYLFSVEFTIQREERRENLFVQRRKNQVLMFLEEKVKEVKDQCGS